MMLELIITFMLGAWIGAVLSWRMARQDMERTESMKLYWRNLYWSLAERRGQTIDVHAIHPPQDAVVRDKVEPV